MSLTLAVVELLKVYHPVVTEISFAGGLVAPSYRCMAPPNKVRNVAPKIRPYYLPSPREKTKMTIVQKVQILHWAELPTELAFPGVQRQRVDSEQMSLIRYIFAPGSVFPAHSHSEEQSTVVLSGEIEFNVADMSILARAGSVLIIPPGVIHSAHVPGDKEAEALSALSPRRIQPILFAANG